MSAGSRLGASAALVALLAAGCGAFSPAAAGDIYLTNQADSYTTKLGDWDIYALGGNDVIRDDGRLASEGGANTIYGGEGNDVITGTMSAAGGRGDDKITIANCNEDDTYGAYGEGGNDTLTASFSNCGSELELNGGPGNDKLVVIEDAGCASCSAQLIGGAGRDVMVGAPGSTDQFVFFGGQSPRGPNHDIMRGFTRGSDVIDLLGSDANKLREGNQTYVFGGQGRNNASWHISREVRDWIRVPNREAKRTGHGCRLLICRLPSRSPWLNPIEPKWVHGKRAVVEPERQLTAAELKQRLCDHYQCQLLPSLAQQVA